MMHQALRKLNSRFVALVLIAMLLITLIPTAAAAESGSCGDGVTWSYLLLKKVMGCSLILSIME